MNWYQKYKESTQHVIIAGKGSYLARKEFEKRLRAIGWDLSEANDGDYMAKAPDGITKLTVVSLHNWDRNWMKPKQHLLRQNPDLEFLFDPIFIIPNNFNVQTQKLEEAPKPFYSTKSIPFGQLPDPKQIKIEMSVDKEWQTIEDIDYSNNQILLMNGNIIQILNNATPINIRFSP
jgi:hypothetical protein